MAEEAIETATVVRTHNDTATVMINRRKTCKGCGKAEAGICGTGGAGMIITVKNPTGAKSGDIVVIDLEKRVHYSAYFLTFVLPILALFAGTYIGSMLSRLLMISSLDVLMGIFSFSLTIVYALNRIRRLDKSEKMYISDVISDSGDTEYDEYASPEGLEYLRAYSVQQIKQV